VRSSRSKYDPEFLRSAPYRDLTKGQRIAAAVLGLRPALRSERERQLRARYGLTLEDYDRLFLMGRGRCWLCKRRWHRHLYVDHSHHTNTVRGLLCAKCNTLVGQIETCGAPAAAVAKYIAC
jgi:hypothetical protein